VFPVIAVDNFPQGTSRLNVVLYSQFHDVVDKKISNEFL